MTTATRPVSESPLVSAYERAATDETIHESLHEIAATFTVEHADGSCPPVWFGAASTETPAAPTIRIVLNRAGFRSA